MKLLTRRRIAVAAAAAVAALLSISAPLTSASAAALPVLHASDFQIAHQCAIIGSDGRYQGVVCVDLDTGMINPPAPTGYWADARVELICETPAGQTVQCANAKAELNLYGMGWNVGTTLFQCGHAYGPCSSGRNQWSTDPAEYGSSWTDSNCTSSLDNVTHLWAVVFGGDTSIELPGSGKTATLNVSNANDNGNQSSGHYFVCP